MKSMRVRGFAAPRKTNNPPLDESTLEAYLYPPQEF